MNYQRIYNKLPYFLKLVALNIKSYANYKKRFKGGFIKTYNKYLSLWYKDIDYLKNYQKQQLTILLNECYQYSPWYKEKMQAIGITKNDINTQPFEVLKKMPILKKLERKKYFEEIVNTNPKRPLKTIDFTSGTSGSPTKNYLDKESIERGFALWKRFHHTIGIPKKVKQVRFSGKVFINPNKYKPPFWIYNVFEKQLFMSTYHLTEKNMSSYIEKLNKYKPEFLDGYPSALYVLANFINKNKLKLAFKPKAIAVTAETLYDNHRVEIEKAFKCKVFNQYASSEGSPFITECTQGNLHVNMDSGIFEFLNNNNLPAKNGEIAKMVVTSFRNFKTPLLRYDIGDTVLLPKEDVKCNCGCNMPIIEKIIGREDDILWTKEKGYVGRMDTAYKGLNGIVKSQIIQETPTLVIINNIVDKNYTKEDETLFIQNLKERLGEAVEFQMNYVEDIPLTQSGKFIAVKRKFKIQNE